ncbi:MAG TPA: class I SAM-dependent methyltransferase [Dehalococcoidia bacterium]|nr:class I SAM-dependent methyltransferase [Dehalococcoidia bacterium]
MPGDVEFYLEEIRRAGSLVLELGCGTGRLLELIAREGFNVVGLDRAPSMLKLPEPRLPCCRPTSARLSRSSMAICAPSL